jgi:hypothetical protein
MPHHRRAEIVVIFQAALSLVLLAAGMMVETLRHLQDQQFG